MRTEKEKMLAGELYDPLDPDLVAARERARSLSAEVDLRGRTVDKMAQILESVANSPKEKTPLHPVAERFKRLLYLGIPGRIVDDFERDGFNE